MNQDRPTAGRPRARRPRPVPARRPTAARRIGPRFPRAGAPARAARPWCDSTRRDAPRATHVINRKREDAPEQLHEVLATLLIQMHQDFRVRGGTEDVAALLEHATQLAMIVDLAVEDDDNVSRLVRHRLVAGGRQVDEGEPAEDELAAVVCAMTRAVGTTMREQPVGLLVPSRCRWKAGGAKPSRYSAHGCRSISRTTAPVASAIAIASHRIFDACHVPLRDPTNTVTSSAKGSIWNAPRRARQALPRHRVSPIRNGIVPSRPVADISSSRMLCASRLSFASSPM